MKLQLPKNRTVPFFVLVERDACRKQKRGGGEAKIEGGSCIKHWGETSFNRVTSARNISPYLYKYLAKNGKSANHWATKHFRATAGNFHFPRRLTNIRYTLVAPAGFDPPKPHNSDENHGGRLFSLLRPPPLPPLPRWENDRDKNSDTNAGREFRGGGTAGFPRNRRG